MSFAISCLPKEIWDCFFRKEASRWLIGVMNFAMRWSEEKE